MNVATLDYLDKNSRRKYPLVDSADLSTNISDLPESLLLDCRFISESISDFQLISVNYTASVATIVVKQDSIYTTITITSPVSRVASTFSTGGITGYFIFGDGLFSLVSATYTLNNPPNFLSSVALVKPVSVQQITLPTGTYTSSLTIQTGSNINVANTAINVDVGSGTGLYDACSAEAGIKTINGIASAKGSFFVSTDACYNLTKKSADTILITPTCTSGCTPDNFNDTAYYLNRINDGISQYGAVLQSLRNDMALDISTVMDTVNPARVKPYVSGAITKYGSSVSDATGTTFYTVICYVYNPSSVPISASVGYIVTGNAAPVSFNVYDSEGGSNPGYSLTGYMLTEGGSFLVAESGGIIELEGQTAVAIGSFTVPCKNFITAKLLARMPNNAESAVLTIATNIGNVQYNVTPTSYSLA